MTEQEWRYSSDIRVLTTNPSVEVSDRKLRLFGCQCLRSIHDELPSESCQCIGIVERALDAQMKWKLAKAQVTKRTTGWERVLFGGRWIGGGNPRSALLVGLPQLLISPQTSVAARSIAVWCASITDGTRGYLRFDVGSFDELFFVTDDRFADLDTSAHVDSFHDIFGNPFRPVNFSPAWRTSAAIGIALRMYDSRNFNAMPILADALQDAGCEDESILSHCRDETQIHVRGCWVVDLVLGKK